MYGEKRSMTSSVKDRAVFRYLLMKSLDGTITSEEIADFNNLLSEFSDLQAYYFKCIHVQLALHDQKALINLKQNGCSSPGELNFLQEFGEYEKTAPAVHIDAASQKLPREIIRKVVYDKPSVRINKGSLLAVALSAAAILLIVIFAQFAVPRPGAEVATLSDSINARWADTNGSMKNGTRLVTGEETLLLRSGIAQLRFDNNALVTVEGPAEFSLIAEDRIKLLYGRLYSTVPQEAMGFSVVTPKAIVIDLGTQFGVQVDFQGTTELHVTQGKTTLVAGDKKNKISMEVIEGFAQRVSGLASVIAEIPCSHTDFARSIDSARNLVWRGEPIDLADIVGGGNGLGTGHYEIGINPVSGELGETLNVDRVGQARYVPFDPSPYIDGVFVPNGQVQPVIVSSEGHVFEECPATNNVFFTEIINSKAKNELPLWKETAPGEGIYGTTTCPSIYMHANLGITFDLDAIRSDYNRAEITQFIADVAMSPAATRFGNVDAWVLVDGKVRFYQAQIKEKGKLYSVRVELKPTDRFLTLLTTDGGDIDYPEAGRRATDSDWAVFTRPRLLLSME